MITSLSCIDFEQLIDYEFIVITHKLGEYLFSGDDCYKNGKKLTMGRVGGSNGYYINGKFRSLSWLKSNRKLTIDFLVKVNEIVPF